MLFSNKVVNILLILRLSAKKELCQNKALLNLFSIKLQIQRVSWSHPHETFAKDTEEQNNR